MKFKKYVVLAVLLLITLVFSGCVNVTYKIELTDNGKANVDLTMLYNSGEYNYDYEKIALTLFLCGTDYSLLLRI